MHADWFDRSVDGPVFVLFIPESWTAFRVPPMCRVWWCMRGWRPGTSHTLTSSRPPFRVTWEMSIAICHRVYRPYRQKHSSSKTHESSDLLVDIGTGRHRFGGATISQVHLLTSLTILWQEPASFWCSVEFQRPVQAVRNPDPWMVGKMQLAEQGCTCRMAPFRRREGGVCLESEQCTLVGW